jgi:hypothetical protein
MRHPILTGYAARRSVYRYLGVGTALAIPWGSSRDGQKEETMIINGYARNTDGTLEIVSCLRDGSQVLDGAGFPLEPTDETTELFGWPDEGTARVYINDGGIEIIIPQAE